MKTVKVNIGLEICVIDKTFFFLLWTNLLNRIKVKEKNDVSWLSDGSSPALMPECGTLSQPEAIYRLPSNPAKEKIVSA